MVHISPDSVRHAHRKTKVTQVCVGSSSQTQVKTDPYQPLSDVVKS